jgi:hypothetical protein
MRYQDSCRFGCLLLAVSGIAGCGGDSTSPATNGTVEIRTSTTGVEMDPDGYAVKLDAGDPLAIGPTATLQSTDLTPGNHTVQLTGLAANCVLSGENPRTASVTAGETMTVSFEITCTATTGGLQVNATTSGASTDADGYSITVDGADRGAIGTSAGISVAGLEAGTHEVGLSGIAANCRVQGDNPQSVAITGGANTTVAFAVTCDAPPATVGTIRVTTATTGADLDPNGYRFAVDGGTAQTIGANAATSLANVAAGNHSIRLSGLAPNCKVQGTNPRSASVAAGATGEASFAISCIAAPGSVEVRATTTGTNLDPDGYSASVDNGTPQLVGVNASVVLSGISSGLRRVTLDGLAANCAIPGENPQQVRVTAGTTASVTFEITCSGGTGPSWTRMTSGTTFTLENVSGSSGTNVFAVGENLTCNTSCGQMTILHYDGTGWATQLNQTGGVEDVWAASANEAFALVTGSSFPGPILHYNGQQWAPMAVQPPPPGESSEEEPSLAAIWGTSGSDVFAVGELFVNVSLSHEYIVHYDGVQWSQMRVSGGDWIKLHDVWGSSVTDVYAVGDYQPHDSDPSEFRAVILHYNGQTWSEVLREPNLALHNIWGSAANDVYATGNSGDDAVIWHYNGSSWAPMSAPVTHEAHAIWGTSSRDIYLLPGDSRPDQEPGIIWHWDGSNWTDLHTEAEGLLDIWGSSATDIFAVGANGTILHGP